MKRILIFALFLSGLGSAVAQNPQINGDLMLCPWTDGTATVTNPIYDTYQWYSKFWFSDDEYVAIAGATEASFTYDWYTYDQSLFKVVATLGSETLTSDVIQIDSYAWVGMTVSQELNETVSFDWDAGHYLLCEGGSFSATVNIPYTANIQWYRDGLPLEGETNATYQITGPGSFHVVAAPEICPNNTSSNEGLPIVVQYDPNCSLGTGDPISLNDMISVYPNPATDHLLLRISDDITLTEYSIIDAAGKVLVQHAVGAGQNTSQIDVSHLSNGFYIIKLETTSGGAVKRFVKN